MNGLQGMEALFEGAHVREAPGTKIERGYGSRRDDVGARAARNDVGVDGDTPAHVVPFFHASNLSGEFVDGVYAFFRSQAGVGSAAMDDEIGFANTFARSFEQAARAKGRLKNEDSIAATGFGFNEFSRGFAADLFVRGPEKDQTLEDFDLQLLQGFESKKGLDDTRLHVKGARTVSFAAGNTEWHSG